MEDLQIEQEDAFFDSRPAGEWMKEPGLGRSEMLFGELWKTGELCVLFGDAGIGKSLLAVQVADSITKRKPIAPFELTAKAQNVLYVDLEKTSAQFKERYSGTTIEQRGRRRRHVFSRRFHRAVPNAGGDVPLRQLTKMVETCGAKIVIIDNLPHLVTSGQPRQAGAILRELLRLRSAYGLSILVIAQTARTASRRGIAAADAGWSSSVTSLADNVFAVGKCGSPSGRYIKHIKPRLGQQIYGTAAVPLFDIESVNGAFPAFVHSGFGIEGQIRSGVDEEELRTMRRIKLLSDRERLSIREIAAEVQMSRSAVHGYLQMARATIEREPLTVFGREACIMEGCGGCSVCKGRPAAILPEYDEAIGHSEDCPDHCDICGPQMYSPHAKDVHAEVRRRSDEFYEKMRAWLSGGKSGPMPVYEGAERFGKEEASWMPGSIEWNDRDCEKFHTFLEDTLDPFEARDLVLKWKDQRRPAKSETKQKRVKRKEKPKPAAEPVTIAALPQPKRPPVYAGPPFCYDNSAKAKEWLDELKAKDPERSADEITRDYERGEEWCRPPGAPPPYDPKDPFSKMEKEVNAARREIFVEHRAPNGQPSVWYQYETNGALFRFNRDSNGVTREKANPNLFGKWATRGG